MIPYRELLIALETHGIEYLVAGGFAVNFHQVQRATVDLDLMLHLTTPNLLSFVELMTKLGFKPQLPVNLRDFADSEKRKEWIEQKNMRVFSFINPQNVFEVIDVFVDEPIPFVQLQKRQFIVEAFGVRIKVIGKNDLIELKRRAGRDKDLFDVAQLLKFDGES